jgi:hypothetical protein
MGDEDSPEALSGTESSLIPMHMASSDVTCEVGTANKSLPG